VLLRSWGDIGEWRGVVSNLIMVLVVWSLMNREVAYANIHLSNYISDNNVIRTIITFTFACIVHDYNLVKVMKI